MLKRIAVGFLVFAIGFSWGFACHQRKVFPYHALRDSYRTYVAWVSHKKISPKSWRIDFYEDASDRKRVECPQGTPLVFLAIGQAGSANHMSSFGERDAGRRAYQFFDGRCYLIEDPVLGATGSKGSLWSSFAQDISVSTGRDVIFITAGAGGSSLADWIRGDSVYFDRAKYQVGLAKKMGYRVNLLLWYQGARESELHTTAEGYSERFGRLMDRFDSLLDDNGTSQWIVFQTSKCWHYPKGSSAVLRGQQLAVEGSDRVFLGPNTDLYDDRYRYDDCHLNHNAKLLANKNLEKIVLRILSAQGKRL